MFVVKRSNHNPILMPVKEHSWESEATFNWSPATVGWEVHVLYRAMGDPELLGDTRHHMSTIGHALSTDHEHYDERTQFIVPEHNWERYGCEDPRITKLGDTYYIFYTALSTFPFSAEGIQVAVAVTKDLKTIEEKHLVTPFNAKAMALFPEKINGRYAAVLTVHTDTPPSHIAVAEVDRIEDFWSESYWEEWYARLDEHVLKPEPQRGPGERVEVGAVPILTDEGWLFVYSHVRNYFTEHEKVFGVEALLLDRDNPRRIIGRTGGPILVPEALYEHHGLAPHIVFPSGALVRGNELEIFYGAADTTSCIAHVNLRHLLDGMLPKRRARRVQRAAGNPIIAPRADHFWEAKATFNPAAVDLDGNVHLLYRAMSLDNTSTLGYARSADGVTVDVRLDNPVYVPRETFETKAAAGNSGCEDPRLIRIDDTIYLFYTAYNSVDDPRVAVSSIPVQKFIAHEWEWAKPELITPPGIMDKDTALLPEMVKGKYLLFHRISDVICIDFLESLDFSKQKVTKCIQLFQPRPGMWDSKKVGIAAPPLLCDNHWLLFYHGISDTDVYTVGAVLLDRKDPSVILSRTTSPLLEPQEPYEREGQTANVVFPCGAVLRDDTVFLYYGGADSTVNLATLSKTHLLDILR
jgi:predicted GH43/DUF377 family glycosyl hydrolase